MYGPRQWIVGPWPFRPNPLPDELLTSWLWRAAEGMGMRPIELLNGVFGSSRSLLNQDLDAFLSAPVQDRLVEGSGLPRQAISGMTLTEHLGSLGASEHPRGRKTWILPTTVASNHRLRHGLQFCPACLRKGPRPYLRRRWRLAFATACTTHGIALLDRCPHCGARVQPHGTPSLIECHACGGSLAGRISERPADPRILARQREHEKALDDGVARLGGEAVHPAMYFTVVRRLAALVAVGRDSEGIRAAVAARTGDDGAAFDRENPRHPLEYLDVVARTRLFGLVDRLLGDWPETFVTTCREAGVTRSAIVKDMEYVPFALDRVLRDHLDDTPYGTSDAEVATVAAYLRRTHGKATYRDLKAICGESRQALYRHMDYQRVQSKPSWRREAAKADALMSSEGR